MFAMDYSAMKKVTYNVKSHLGHRLKPTGFLSTEDVTKNNTAGEIIPHFISLMTRLKPKIIISSNYKIF